MASLQQQGQPINMKTPHCAVAPSDVKQGPTMDGETRFLNLNFALKDPGTRALPFMNPWKEHSCLRRRSWCTQIFCGSTIPKTNEDLHPGSYLPCSREEERWQAGMANHGQTRCTQATTLAMGK